MTPTMTPEAYVAIGKNRQKVYPGGKLFMRSGQEFSLELFNPTRDVISAKIYLNDKQISDRVLVVKPGERAFLERYIDSPNKFKFETYEVENTTVAKQAIANNGKVRVEFFREKQAQPVLFYGNTYIPVPYPVPYPWSPTPYYPTWYTTTGRSTGIGVTGGDVSSLTCTSYNAAASGSCTSYNAALNNSSIPDSIETGMVAAGSHSDQSFGSYTGEFESYYFTSTEYQIIPDSQKPVEINQIRMYCPNCRTRIRKSNWHYCNQCGTKLD